MGQETFCVCTHRPFSSTVYGVPKPEKGTITSLKGHYKDFFLSFLDHITHTPPPIEEKKYLSLTLTAMWKFRFWLHLYWNHFVWFLPPPPPPLPHTQFDTSTKIAILHESLAFSYSIESPARVWKLSRVTGREFGYDQVYSILSSEKTPRIKNKESKIIVYT